MQSDPRPRETTGPPSSDLRVRALRLEAAREAHVGRTARDDEYDREEDRAEEERVTMANYGETQAVADGDEPPTEPYAA